MPSPRLLLLAGASLLSACAKAPASTASAEAAAEDAPEDAPEDAAAADAGFSTAAPPTGPAIVGTAPVGPAAADPAAAGLPPGPAGTPSDQHTGSVPPPPQAEAGKPAMPTVTPGGEMLVPIPVKPAPAGLSPTPAETDSAALVAELDGLSSDADRLALLDRTAPGLRLTVEQARKLVATLSSDEDKLAAVGLLAPGLVDPEHGTALAEELSSAAAQAEVRARFD